MSGREKSSQKPLKRQTSFERRLEEVRRLNAAALANFRSSRHYNEAIRENALERQTSYEKKHRAWTESKPQRDAEKARRMEAKMKRQESEERRRLLEAEETDLTILEMMRLQQEEDDRLAGENSKTLKRVLESRVPVVQGNVSFDKTAAEMEEMIANNKERHNKTAKEYPGLFGVTRKASGKKHKKRKTHKKRKGKKKSRKH